jgi:hypothetical protein
MNKFVKGVFDKDMTMAAIASRAGMGIVVVMLLVLYGMILAI